MLCPYNRKLISFPEPFVTCQTQTVEDTVFFAPGHDRIAGTPAIGAHNDSNLPAKTFALPFVIHSVMG
jgi:hypothetical protein